MTSGQSVIVIENCRFGYGHGGVAMGSETSGGIRHVEVRNTSSPFNLTIPLENKGESLRSICQRAVYE
jgi:hypothetical protein